VQNKRFCKKLPFSFVKDLKILALWFMDDGGRGGNTVQGLVIDISAFTQTESVVIQKVLYDKFHLLTSLHYHNKENMLVLSSRKCPSFY
jgi:hypothetical protein